MSEKLGKSEFASSCNSAADRISVAVGLCDVFASVGSELDRRLNKPSSSVDDVSKIKSDSCSPTLCGFVGVCGFVWRNGGSSLKCVIVGVNKSCDVSSSMPTSVSDDELECCVCCSMNARSCWFCENKMSVKDDSRCWSDCCWWFMSSSWCCCCCCNR